MSRITVCGVAASVLSGVLAWAPESHATLYFYDPFGDEPSTMFIGTDPNWGDTQWIGWEKYPTGECVWEQIGTGSVLSDYIRIFGLGGDDWLFSVPAEGVTFCGYYITPPNTDELIGTGIGLEGGDGDDLLVLHGGLRFLNYIVGGAGNDDLRSHADDWLYPPSMNGGAGNDRLFGSGPMTGGGLGGDTGDDCLQVASSSAGFSNCGAGADSWASSATKPSDCETNVGSCY
jgi:hypothetical protein